VSLLQTIRGPRDLKDLSPDQLPQLAAEIRDQLIAVVTSNGGHLGPNLGVVELTIALHRVFDSPVDRIVFDTGHQSYVHKLLTGRHAEFGSLRQRHGLSGYPSRAESEHDVIENSHASTSLSYADGLAKAYQLRDEPARSVVAVIGDGALTGGMAWEALNNISADSARCGSASGTRTCSNTSRPRCPGPRWSARRCTAPCTASRRASRTSCSRRCCSRTWA
jgi:1-deoxy-D-xylulose-5-phosphate synthase